MLYGIRPNEQRRLAELGHPVRVYMPYGADWYGYFMRRLAERPANVAFFLRALATPVVSRLAVLGAGKMGEALLSGLLRAGRPVEDLTVVVRRAERAKELEERYGVRAVPAAEAAGADVLLVTVKPQDIGALLDELAPHVQPRDRWWSRSRPASRPRYYEQRLATGVPVVRVMTNTPVLVDEAMSAISAGAHATERHLALTEELLRPVGKVLRVPESQQDAVTALSGSGPAYFFYLVEAMIDAGILLGMPAGGRRRPARADRARRGGDAARLRRAPGEAARGGHLAGRHDHQRDPRAGEARRPRRVAGRDRGRPRPVAPSSAACYE